ncbi:hypothetical protein [Microbulbifer sp. JMSA008]|uniref:hypothetical protein n=1 Tax=Microbulbifer sp. JMSA008 TaxID=3243373 RepID=UPI004039124F
MSRMEESSEDILIAEKLGVTRGDCHRLMLGESAIFSRVFFFIAYLSGILKK